MTERTAAQDTVLRFALRAVLLHPQGLAPLDVEALTQRLASIEDTRASPVLTPAERAQLIPVVLQWADQLRPDVGQVLRQALGEETTETQWKETPWKPGQAPRGQRQQHSQETRAMILPVETEIVNVGRNGTAMEEVIGLDSKALQELHIQRELMDNSKFNVPMKKLVDAFKCVERGRVTVGNAPGVYRVQGSKGNEYFVNDDGCTCPHGLHSTKTKYGCYHSVAVELYKRWQAAMQPLMALPLPPVTVNERLAQPTPQEIPMAAPRADEYIPEPATADAATTPRVGIPTVVPEEVPVPALVRMPETTLAAVALEASLEEWGKQRKVITKYIREHFVEGVDYYTLKVGGRETKPTLGKSGSEKFLSLFQLQASFRKDEDTWEMLGRPHGVLCFVCTLHTRSGEVVGEGRGCRDLKKDGGDPNKAVKMSQKSACVDAILRTGALSDAFTQDLDQDIEEQSKATTEAPRGTAALSPRQHIAQLLKELGEHPTEKAAYEQVVKARTGLELVERNFPAIIERLIATLQVA